MMLGNYRSACDFCEAELDISALQNADPVIHEVKNWVIQGNRPNELEVGKNSSLGKYYKEFGMLRMSIMIHCIMLLTRLKK